MTFSELCLQVGGRPQAQLQLQLLWKLRQYLDQLLQAGSFGVVMSSVMQELKAGLHISRLSREDFVCFFRLAQLATAYVRIRQVCSLSADCSPILFAILLEIGSCRVRVYLTGPLPRVKFILS